MASYSKTGEKKNNHVKRSRLLVISILLLVTAGAVWFLQRGNESTASATKTTSTTNQTAKVRLGDLQVSIGGTGTLVAASSVDLSFTTSGQVSELNVALGDPVTSGQVLAKLGNTETLEANVASAQLDLLVAQNDLKELQNNADVALAQAYQDWVLSKADYADALYAVQRTAYARCTQDVNAQNLNAVERAQKNLDKYEIGTTEYIGAKEYYETVVADYNYCLGYTADEKTERQANLELADQTMQTAEIKYNTLKEASGIDPDELALAEATVTQTETSLAEAQKTLEGATLIAPMNGTVTYLAAGAGSIVDTSLFITISDLTHPTVEVNVDETDLPNFVVGSQAQVVFDALPDSVFYGKLIQVDPQLTNTNNVRTATGLVLLDENTSGGLQSLPLGLNGSVDLIVSEVKDAVLVSIDALNKQSDGSYVVYLVSSDGQYTEQPVEIGGMDTAFAVVLNGLKEGDVVSTGVVVPSK